MHQLAAYFKEREDFDSIVTDKGFATYAISGEECYIRDIWVSPDFRQFGIASALADQIAEIAKKANCKYLTGSVSTTAKGATVSTKILFAYGFSIHSAVPNGIYFRKDL
jgi:ribosomal protein S18 acetylase RimI-like enzyme